MEYNMNNQYFPSFVRKKEFKEDAYLILIHNQQILLKQVTDICVMPMVGDLKDFCSSGVELEYIGTYDGHDCFCVKLPEGATFPAELKLVNIREITEATGDRGLFLLAGTASHILHWIGMNQFCGRCGHDMEPSLKERARICPACGNTIYPRIAPATITAICRKNEILLAHNQKFKEGLYSLIAGFVEPGETLEECVEREIMEEVGLKVKNVRYLSSQPWPFPDSLMLAFTAEYESGEIRVDQEEITDAQWYTADTLPLIPTGDSVAGRMIQTFRKQGGFL